MRPFNIGRSPKAETWTINGERALQILLPPGTKTETAQKAIQAAVQKWTERLAKKEYLRLVSDVDIEGPYLCPFLEHNGQSVYGDDMWIARARFTSEKPIMVKDDLLESARRLSEDADMSYFDFRTAKPNVIPDDAAEQLQFVAANADAVYDDLRQLEQMKKEKRSASKK